MIKKGFMFFILAIFVMTISGCEIVDAMRTGDIKTRDIGHMIGLGITGDVEKENTIWGITGDVEKENTIWEKIKEADAWIKKNLW